MVMGMASCGTAARGDVRIEDLVMSVDGLGAGPVEEGFGPLGGQLLMLVGYLQRIGNVRDGGVDRQGLRVPDEVEDVGGRRPDVRSARAVRG